MGYIIQLSNILIDYRLFMDSFELACSKYFCNVLDRLWNLRCPKYLELAKTGLKFDLYWIKPREHQFSTGMVYSVSYKLKWNEIHNCSENIFYIPKLDLVLNSQAKSQMKKEIGLVIAWTHFSQIWLQNLTRETFKFHWTSVNKHTKQSSILHSHPSHWRITQSHRWWDGIQTNVQNKIIKHRKCHPKPISSKRGIRYLHNPPQ